MEQQMETLPPKYLKPIYMNVEAKVITRPVQTLPVKVEVVSTTASSFEGATASYTQGAEAFTTQTETFNTTTESFATGTENYTTGAQAFETGAEFAQSSVGVIPGYETTQTTTTTTTTSTFGTGVSTGFKLIRRGSGITANEQQNIADAAIAVRQQGLTPISNNTASSIKKRLKGDWLVIVYQEGKPIDFNMTCVQGNDYLYFTLDGYAYQVCRLN